MGKSQMEPLIFLIYFISFIVIILETKAQDGTFVTSAVKKKKYIL